MWKRFEKCSSAVIEVAGDGMARCQRRHARQLAPAARPRLGLARGTRLTTIAGSVPDLVDLPAGCAFADRCPDAVEACRSATGHERQHADRDGADGGARLQPARRRSPR